jgi:8-oxo-dGTP diphosphatase
MLRNGFIAHCWRALPRGVQWAILWLCNTHFLVGTVAVIRDDAGRVLVAKHTYRAGRPWGLLGGWVQRGEDPAATIVREVREETGLTVTVGAPLAVRRESATHLTIVYAARLHSGAFRASGEVSEIHFLERGTPLEELRADHRAMIEEFAWSKTSGR